MMKIYLAGAMSGLTDEEMNSWRINATELLDALDCGIRVFNPCDYYNFSNDKKLEATDEEIMEFDIYTLVKHSNVLLVNLTHPGSIGTAIECHDAKEWFHIPVVAFGTKEEYSKTHPWVRASLNKYFPKLEDAIDYIATFYTPMFK